LEDARAEMEALRRSLKERERAAEAAALESSEREKAISSLEKELAALRERADDTSGSEAELEAAIAALRAEQERKEQALAEAAARMDALKVDLTQRDEALLRSEYLIERARKKKTPRWVWPVLAAMLLLAAASMYFNYYLATESMPAEADEFVVALQFPEETPLGILYWRNAEVREEAEWQPLSEAQGVVRTRQGRSHALQVNEETSAALTPLENLPPDTIQALWLPSFRVSDENLATLKHFNQLQELRIESFVGPTSSLEELRAALPDTAVEAVTMEAPPVPNEPPPARSLTFPQLAGYGRVWAREWQPVPTKDWREFAPATGSVNVPAGLEVKLEVDQKFGDQLQHLAALGAEDLYGLGLAGEKVTDAQMSYVAGLTGLQSLSLTYTNVSDEGIRTLNSLTNLREVSLYSIAMSDAGMAVLNRMPHLRSLWILGADITNASLQTLRSMKSLQRLHLGNTGISAEGILHLRSYMPYCEISTPERMRTAGN
jgi:hypothetical protein